MSRAAGGFLVVGESVADIVRSPGRADVVHPGGSPANVAYGLGRLGHRPALLTQLGADPLGDLIRAHLTSAGVMLLDGGRTDVDTPSAVVSLDEAGRASYAFDIAWTLRPVDPEALLAALPGPPRHVHLGSIASVAEPGADAALALVRSLRGGGAVVSYDPNVRPTLMGDRDAALTRVERCVAAAHVVKASDEDLAWLYPDATEAEVAARWTAAGAQLVIVTRGAAGAVAYAGEQVVAAPARPTTVVDTVGAGDAFMAAVLHGLHRAEPGHAELDHTEQNHAAQNLAAQNLAALDTAALTALLDVATAAAAITVSRAGANPPDAAELAALLSPRTAPTGAGTAVP
ncbi:carbohydrate kinase family protein [Streptacidiphilus fuscans]|uniref:Carbohydrate kinase n=1 Tax=Streptacidiphilus fuscans TaxID=2789292 RepID=A0A931B4J4_9ACTN|nr:carbohydrate kinase [Streptacidiphilus fuscans]MBF9071095.1 carbohydrate kinase [Streptacidiphilus fuscans]